MGFHYIAVYLPPFRCEVMSQFADLPICRFANLSICQFVDLLIVDLLIC